MKQETPQPKIDDGFIEVAGGHVYYQHAGSGPPMLLIHGLVGSSTDWRNNIGALAQHASVYAIDLMNMGRSERVSGLDPTLAATARRITGMMDALGLASADIVGHSHGGAVALMLAALYPTRVNRLILFAPANPYNRSSDLVVRLYSTSWGGVLAWLLPFLPTRLQCWALAGMYGGVERVRESNVREIACCLRNFGSLRHVLGITRGWFAEEPKLKAALRRIKQVPTLLIWGDQDRTVSLRSGKKLKRRLRASKLVVLQGYGHSAFEDAPEVVNRIMLTWLGYVAGHVPYARSLRRRATALARRARGAAGVRRLSPGNMRP